MFITWIWIQGATSQQQKNETIMLLPKGRNSNHSLVCSPRETIEIKAVFYYSKNGSSCSKFEISCQSARALFNEECSNKTNRCSIGDISNQSRVCLNSSVKADCLAVVYSCVPETSTESFSMTSPITSENIEISHSGSEHGIKPLLVIVLTIAAGVVAIVVLAVLTTCCIYRTKRNRIPDIGIATNSVGADNPYYTRKRDEPSEQTLRYPCHDKPLDQFRQYRKNNNVADRSHHSHVNTKGLAPFAQTNAEKHTMPTTKAIPDDAMLSSYNTIQLQSIHSEDKKRQKMFAYGHFTNNESHLHFDTANSERKYCLDHTYNHLDDGFLKSFGHQEMDPYDHLMEPVNAFRNETIAEVMGLDDTYNHLERSSPKSGAFSSIDESEYSHASLTNNRHENAFTPHVYSGASAYDHFSLDTKSTQQSALTVNSVANAARNQQEFGPGKKIIDDLDEGKYSTCNKGGTPFMEETKFDTDGKQRTQNDDFGQFNSKEETLDHDYFILNAVEKNQD